MLRLPAACLALAALLAACATPAPQPAPASTAGDSVVYVIRRKWHTDIGLPVNEITSPLATLEHHFPGVRYLTFGFGERQFLINRETNAFTMLGALLPSQSALLMTALRAPPEQAFGAQNVIQLHVSQAVVDRIESAIWNELEHTQDGKPMELADGPYVGSVFYAAHDTYDGFFTCNTWVAKTLREGGLPMPVTFVLFAGQVMDAAGEIGPLEQDCAERNACTHELRN